MKKLIKIMFLFLSVNNLVISEEQPEKLKLVEFDMFADIVQKNLPKNRELANNVSIDKDSKYLFGKLGFLKELEFALDSFYKDTKSRLLSRNSWLKNAPYINEKLLDIDYPNYFKPFVQKKIVTGEDTIIFKGDLHGDIHSLISFLQELQNSNFLEKNSFKIKDASKYLVFLGDYTDRGQYGVEVIYTILRLKIENPDQVILIRGNHEDLQLNMRYGFCREFMQKFKNIDASYKDKCMEKICKFYNLLPVALYLGSGVVNKNFILCCHGGLEIGFNAEKLINSRNNVQYQFVGALNRRKEANKLSHFDIFIDSKMFNFKHICKNFNPRKSLDLGFLWNDFVVKESSLSNYSDIRGFSFNKELTKNIINLSNFGKNKVKGIFRAHQHTPSDNNGLMRLMIDNYGVACLWTYKKLNKSFNLFDGIVCTFLLSPDNPQYIPRPSFKSFNFDTWGILKTAQKFEDWTLSLVNNNIF